jgi:hypothetical protein
MRAQKFREWLVRLINQYDRWQNEADINNNPVLSNLRKVQKEIAEEIETEFDTVKFPEWVSPDRPPDTTRDIFIKIRLVDKKQNSVVMGYYDCEKKLWTDMNDRPIKDYGFIRILSYMEIPE